MAELFAKRSAHSRFESPMPAAAPTKASDAPTPSWAVGLTALAAFASATFTALLYLNNR